MTSNVLHCHNEVPLLLFFFKHILINFTFRVFFPPLKVHNLYLDNVIVKNREVWGKSLLSERNILRSIPS